MLIILPLSTNAIPLFQQSDDLVDNPDTVQVDTQTVKPAFEAPVFRNARDSIKADWQTKKVYLYGEAHVMYGDIDLKADLIVYDMDKSVFMATYTLDSLGNKVGQPVFSDGTEEIFADTIRYNSETKRGVIKNVRTQVAEGYIDGKIVVKDEDDVLYIKDGRYCPCEDPDAHTKFRITKIKVMEDLIVTGPGYLELAGVPTPIMFPFGFFPNKKKQHAGLIVPTFGESPALGFFLQDGGFYLPIGEKMDMQFKGDIYSRGSWGLKNFTRYKTRYKYEGDFFINYSKLRNSDPEFPDYSESTNFWVTWNHRQDPKASPYNRFTARVNAGTSNNFQNNFASTNANYLSNQFNSNINYTRLFPGKPFNLSLGANHDQNTQTGVVNVTLPSMSFNVSRVNPFKIYNKDGRLRGGFQKQLEKVGMTFRLEGINRARLQDTLIAMDNLDYISSNIQNGFKHTMNINSPWRFWKKRITFNLASSWTGRYYFETIRKYWDADSLELVTDTTAGFAYNDNYNVSGGLTTKIYGYYAMKGKRGRTFRHMFTPNVTFTYRPDFGTQEQFTYINPLKQDTVDVSYSRYDIGVYGKAPSGESGRLSFNLINSLDMKVNAKVDSTGEASKTKIIENLNIVGGYDFIADSLNIQDFRLDARTTLFKNLRLTYSSTFDPYWYDAEGNKRNILNIDQTGKLARLKDASLATSFRFASKNAKKTGLGTNTGSTNTGFTEEEEDELISRNQDPFDYYDVPWALSVSHTIRYNRRFYSIFDSETDETNVIDSVFYTQTLRVNGDIKLSPKWKIVASTTYDFVTRDFGFTTVNIERDLNCWVARFNWVPFGNRRSYSLTIALKNPLLRDVKYTRQRSWFDQEFF